MIEFEGNIIKSIQIADPVLNRKDASFTYGYTIGGKYNLGKAEGKVSSIIVKFNEKQERYTLVYATIDGETQFLVRIFTPGIEMAYQFFIDENS